MRSFTVGREVDAPVQDVWALLTDWSAHARWVAATRVTLPDGPGRQVGGRFVARTGGRRLGFDDPMTVLVWQPPVGATAGRCVLRKEGRVVLGRAILEVQACGARRSQVRWTEQVEVAGVRRLPFADRVSALVGRLVFAGVLGRAAREVEAQQAQR